MKWSVKRNWIVALVLTTTVLLAACGDYSGEGNASGESVNNTGENDANNNAGQNNDNNEPAAEANPDAKVIKFASTAAAGQPLSVGIDYFGELVEEKTGGSVVVENYTDGVLGGDMEMMDGLRAGTLEAASISTGPISSLSSRFAVFDLPFLFESDDVAFDVLDGPVGEGLLEDLEEIDMVGLGYWDNGFRYLTNNVREVTSVEDVEGLDIRLMEVPLHLDAWEQLGANPTPMAFTELFSALESGVVDGQEGTYPNMRYNQFHEVQEYFTDTGHIYSPTVLLISKSFWDDLTDEEQAALQEASDEARDYQRELAKEDNIESHEIMAEYMTMTELTPEARQGFVDALSPIYEQYRDEIGPDLIDEVLEAVAN
ncbi:DctP family TRAP transporter solute-binding subunit [Salipaludibacillus aurantiacus]|uniref:Tripartite ATP-independent transporter solute receptor, DctP family n=1 Tax=Salipaludibacillus aurantiacus TaxID=1601833 RepID=A0A1H9W2M4_9BACI|nr:DctP family TRAP transporter solute-binding subunit [Salipaludibacillus aurantiacus]SES28039.1 tripartite ATP-independent transporter solute receptor, DctP family [Salipaludibacillus aurantiacus]